VTLSLATGRLQTSISRSPGCGGMLKATGPELTNRRSKTRVRLVPGYMRTYTVRKAIRRMLRIGISVPVSLRPAIRSKTSGLQLRTRCFADLSHYGAVARPTVC